MISDADRRKAAALLRAAAPEDVPAIHAIYRHHVLHGLASFEETPPAPDEIERRYVAVRARGLPWLVAADGEEIAGYAYCAPYRERSAYRFSLEDSVYVRDGRQGRGIGKALLARLIAESEALGYRQLVAVIGDSANLGSIALHARLGFGHAGTLRSVGYKFGRWVDSVFMQRPLGLGDRSPPTPCAPA